MTHSSMRKKIVIEYCLVALVSILVMTVVLKLWAFHIALPNAYYGDGWSYLAVVRGMIERGPFGGVLEIERLGAPTGAVIADTMVYQQAGLHNLLMKLIGFILPNDAVVLNLYYLMSYPLISLATYFLLRESRVSRSWALVGALLFSFTNYHIYRNTYNIYLGVYFMVPLAFTVLLWLVQKRLVWQEKEHLKHFLRRPRMLASLLIFFLLGASDAYYTFFLLPLLALQATGIRAFGAKERRRQVAVYAMLLAALAAGVLILVIPALLERHAYPNPETQMYPLQRHFYMADKHSLRLDTMILPSPLHRVPKLRKGISHYENWLGIHGEPTSAPNAFNWRPLANEIVEVFGVSLGIIPTLGFFIGLALVPMVIRRRGLRLWPMETEIMLRQWSVMNLGAFLLATTSGFGVLVALVYPEVRFYIRLSLFIQLGSILIFCLSMDHAVLPWLRKRNAWRFLIFLLPLCTALFGIWDQTPYDGAYGAGDYSANLEAMGRKNARYEADRSFIAQVENALPPHTMVFELPYVSFWTYNEAVGHIEYDHLLPFLHSRTLRWSYGSLIGTPVDLWQRRVARKPMPDALREMAALGFGAVYVDREGYGDHGASVIAQLSSLLHDQPIVSPDGRRLVFLLPSPGFVLQVDPHRYWPIRMRLTERASITPERLPDYIPPEPLFAWLAAHPRATDIAGDDLDALLDAPMLRQLTGYDDAPLPEAAWRGRIACPAGATITYRPQAPQADYMVPVTVHNDSDVWWNFDGTRNHPLTIRSHLIRADGTMENNDYPYQLFVAAAVPPHRTRTLNATFSATELQSLAGTHLLQLDIMQDGVAWLSGKYAPNTTCNVRIISGD